MYVSVMCACQACVDVRNVCILAMRVSHLRVSAMCACQSVYVPVKYESVSNETACKALRQVSSCVLLVSKRTQMRFVPERF